MRKRRVSITYEKLTKHQMDIRGAKESIRTLAKRLRKSEKRRAELVKICRAFMIELRQLGNKWGGEDK